MTGLFATKSNATCIAALAEEALWQELELTPKPGLVDKYNNGAHRDMDHALFVRSIAAFTPWFFGLRSWVRSTRIFLRASSCE